MNAFEEYFSNNRNFTLEHGVYCQSDFSGSEFEQKYTDIRTREGRMYSDDVVRHLPKISRDHALSYEWSIRGLSAKKLVDQLKKENCSSLLEIGCGNGWLSNYIQHNLNIPVCGIDVGKSELQQAARISHNVFVYGDIMSIDGLKADTVLLASCIQYFPDIRVLINALSTIGTIHVIDSPVYANRKGPEAKDRSAKYFDSMDVSQMQQHYYHHERKDFENLGAEFLYDPLNPIERFKKLYTQVHPFPWIRIGK